MNNEFIIDDGLQEYTFKNKRGDVIASFTFNATDTGILTRYENVVNKFNDLVLKEIDEDRTTEEIVKLENDITECFNELFGRDMKNDLFSMYKPLTLFGNGIFYCRYIFERVEEIIEIEFNTRLESSKAKVKKATKKYTH